MKRRICVVTGTRAEFGLLRRLMGLIRDAGTLELQVIATGMHLSPEFGLTYQEIEQDGFVIDCKIECLLSADTPSAVTKSMGLGLIGFADAYARLKPDLLVVLGDRYEILSAVSAALIARVPVAHLHGGETTEGAFDEGIRHAITKMSHLHFVAADAYRDRVIQLGEHPERVFQVGGLGVDNIMQIPLLTREALEASLDCQLSGRNLLITFHPVTLENATSEGQMHELLAALAEQQDTRLIFTLPNADTDSRILIRMIQDFVATHEQARAYTSLGQLRYLSLMREVDAVVGNSSSGLAEAPSFGIGTINIGDRQLGRLKASSVIDCPPERGAILSALDQLYSPDFQSSLGNVQNPYGKGGAAEQILQVISTYPLNGILKKSFHDLPPATPMAR